MKRILVFSILFLPLGLFAQSAAAVQSINQALGKGDVNALAAYFDQSVEVAIGDTEDLLPKAQALQSVRDFFAKNPAKSFSTVHQGTSKGRDSHYFIGNLVTAGGTFRVYVYLSKAGNEYRIQELRFDKE